MTGKGWLRDRGGDDSAQVGYAELFFDLVFVFACTRLSLILVDDLSAEGVARAVLLLVAVWWVWIYTTLAANWLDPDRSPVRFVVFGLMLAGLVMSVSIPRAFEERGLSFALGYVTIQVGRTVFMIWAMRREGHAGAHSQARMAAWLIASGALWIAGGLAEGDARFGLWAAALVFEVISPAIGFWLPGLGRSGPEHWDIEGPHLAERCALFIIIALGESMLVMGGTMDRLDWSGLRILAFLSSFGTTVAMWWIYFDKGAPRGERAMEKAARPGRLAQVAYTYLHLVIVAGIVLCAVADEIVLSHPEESRSWQEPVAILSGPAAFILGTLLFKRAVTGRVPLSHLVGLAAVAAGLLFARGWPPVALHWLSLAALGSVATLERLWTPRGAPPA